MLLDLRTPKLTQSSIPSGYVNRVGLPTCLTGFEARRVHLCRVAIEAAQSRMAGDAPVVGCEYGDRVFWCQSQRSLDCSDPQLRYDCCHTCTAGLTSRALTPFPVTWPDDVTTRRGKPPRYTYVTSFPATIGHVTAPSDVTRQRGKPSRYVITTMSSFPATGHVTDDVNIHPGSQSLTCSGSDRASFCSTMPVPECYHFSRLCCKRCAKHYTGVAGILAVFTPNRI